MDLRGTTVVSMLPPVAPLQKTLVKSGVTIMWKLQLRSVYMVRLWEELTLNLGLVIRTRFPFVHLGPPSMKPGLWC